MEPSTAAAEAPAAAAATPKPYRVYVKTVQVSSIRTLVEVLKEVVHDTTLKFTESGIGLCTLDGSRCSLLHLHLRASSFEEYVCTAPFSAGINMSSLYKLLKSSGSSSDSVTLYVEPDKTDELQLEISNADKGAITVFSLKLLDVDSEEISLPDFEFDSIITLPSQYFQRLCRDMLQLSDTITIKIQQSGKNSSLHLSTVGDFASQHTHISSNDGDDDVSISSKTEGCVEGSFSLKYLSLFTRASALSATTLLLFKQDFPLIITYNVASLGELKFVLAHKTD